MNTISNIRYTPEKVVENSLSFRIPIFQRLFAWEEKQVSQLMTDLFAHYNVNSHRDVPYYIGALSGVQSDDRCELIDGQQRMIIISLLAIAFNESGKYDSTWGKFLADGERLHFVARSSDMSYFRNRIRGNNTNQTNNRMEQGIETIQAFLMNHFELESDREEFSKWVFKNLSFFISMLPDSYKTDKSLLNKYFEDMNTGGKGLEEHDILKVQLIEGESNQNELIRIWNTACDLSQKAIRKTENESSTDYAKKYQTAISLCRAGRVEEALGMCIGSYEEEDRTTIDEIAPIKYETGERRKEVSRHPALMTIAEFLLMVLDLQNYNAEKINHESFYRRSLLKTFSKEVKGSLDITKYYHDLLFYRLLLDYYFISLEREDWGIDYTLVLDDSDKEMVMRCCQYEAMLNVADTPLYHWITPLMHTLKTGDMSSKDLHQELKHLDRMYRGNIEKEQLRFPDVNIYWFRRLEYLIWENRKELFSDSKDLAIAESYRFISNRRSREHIIPQTPKSESNLKWDDSVEDANIRNSFGNLVLISSSLNSKLSNESYQIKQAYVKSFQTRSLGGAIESLSLLLFHTRYPDLDKDNMRECIKEYEEVAYNILKTSF